VGVIQGDGIGPATIATILDAVLAAGFSAQSVAFGMGGGLLQKVNRDSCSFAVKLCHVVRPDGAEADIMKAPKGAPEKDSLPGVLAVKRVAGVPTAFPAAEVAPEDNLLRVVYDCGPVEGLEWEEFDALRRRVADEWEALPPVADVWAPSLRRRRAEVGAEMRARGGGGGDGGGAAKA
jgi:nicotinamide phosphoribosyltransferase